MSCPSCGGAGWYVLAVPLADPRFGQLQPCACTLEHQQAARQHRAHERRSERLASLREGLGYLAHATFQTFAQDRELRDVTWLGTTYAPMHQRRFLHTAVRACQGYALAPTGWLYLYGPCGSGKTHLAAAIANGVADRMDVTYASAPSLLRYIRAGFADNTADARLEAVQHVDLLLLDDIGSELSSNWSEALLFDLLNERYLRALPTVLTSNVLVQDLSPRIASRIEQLAGKGGTLALPLSDYRSLIGSARERAA